MDTIVDLTPILINLVTVLVGSVLEKADAQSTEAWSTALIPGLSSKLRTLSLSFTTRCSVPMVDVNLWDILRAAFCDSRDVFFYPSLREG